jgi:Fic family protein
MQNNIFSQIDDLQKQINKHRPLNKQEVAQLKEYFRIGCTYSSNALEGNSLTESETKVVIEDGITIGGKPLKDHYEAMGHSEAYDLLFEIAKKKAITKDDINKFHHAFYYRIDEAKAGKYRKIRVFISGTEYVPPPPIKVPALMKAFEKRIPAMRKKYHPVEFSALLHKELVAIHPYVDGNGRAARLLMNLALLQEGCVVTIIPPVLRREYIAAIVKGQVAPQDDKPFIELVANAVLETQKDYLRLLK